MKQTSRAASFSSSRLGVLTPQTVGDVDGDGLDFALDGKANTAIIGDDAPAVPGPALSLAPLSATVLYQEK